MMEIENLHWALRMVSLVKKHMGDTSIGGHAGLGNPYDPRAGLTTASPLMGQSTTRRRRYTKLWRGINKIPNDNSDIIYSDTVPQDFSTTLKGPSTKYHMNKKQKKSMTDTALMTTIPSMRMKA